MDRRGRRREGAKEGEKGGGFSCSGGRKDEGGRREGRAFISLGERQCFRVVVTIVVLVPSTRE